MTERRAHRTEFRADGRTIRGEVVAYGRAARVADAEGRMITERIEVGAFADYIGGDVAMTTTVNLDHDGSIEVGSTAPGERRGRLTLQDSRAALNMALRLPHGGVYDDILRLVRDGSLSETSIEFVPVAEDRRGDDRRIKRAWLPAVALVPAGAYAGKVEARAAKGTTVRGSVPLGKRLQCECAGPNCEAVTFEAGAFDDLPVEALAIVSGRRYEAPLAALSRGGLRLQVADEALQVEVDLPDTAAGREVVDAAAAAPIYVRPYLHLPSSEYTEAGGLRTFTKARLRAVLVGATDASAGHVEAELVRRRRSAEPAPAPAPGLGARLRWPAWL